MLVPPLIIYLKGKFSLLILSYEKENARLIMDIEKYFLSSKENAILAKCQGWWRFRKKAAFKHLAVFI